MAGTSRKKLRWLALAGGVLLLLVLQIDNWGRDFVSHQAAIHEDSTDPELRPLLSKRTTDDLILAVRGAARRIRDWEYLGQARDGGTVSMLFVRTHRLLRVRDDINVRVEDLGSERRVTAVSVSRLELGDLGRNPRNLKRLLNELREVLAGAAPQTSEAS